MTTTHAQVEQTDSSLNIRLQNGTSIAFALDGQRLLGIRDVTHHDTPMRNPDMLWRPHFYTEAGIHYTGFVLKSAVPDEDGGVVVEAEAIGVRTLRREEDDEYLCDVLDLVSDTSDVNDRFTWLLKPSRLELAGHEFNGFSYVYEFHSTDPERQIYRVFDSATWEIGGHLEGNTLLYQGQTNPPVMELKIDDYFTTSCNYYGAEMGGVMSPAERVSMQRLPRIGTIQTFDFMHHEKGVLFNYFDPAIDVVSVLQTDIGEDVLHVLDELRRPLSDEFVSHPKHVLFLPTEEQWTREEYRNLWSQALDFVHEKERARHNITASPALPRVWTPQVGSDEYCFGSDTGPREKVLYYLADNVLPKWADMGVKEVCTPSYWVCDYTVDRFKKKDDTGLQGGLIVSGICCVRVHEIDPIWGGPEAVAYLAEAAHRLDMTLHMWWATHLSRRAPIFEEHPEFMIRSRDNQPGCAGIGKDIIVPMDLSNPDCLEWEFNKLKAVYEATGIDGLFHDSYGNYTFLPVNYSNGQRKCQQEAYGQLISKLQALGLKYLSVEGLGPWGVGHFGMKLLPSDPGERKGYQNALDWWIGHEDMTYRLNMGIHQDPWPGREKESEEFAFRCMANGGRFGFTDKENGIEMWSGWLKDMNRVHAQVGPLIGGRQLLTNDSGVIWDCEDGTRTLFAFRSLDFSTNGSGVSILAPDGETEMSALNGNLRTEPWTVYRLK